MKQDQNANLNGEKTSECGINSLFLPLGVDNTLTEVDPKDNGAIIATALSSNLYKESLINNNYLDFQQRYSELNNKTNDNFINQVRSDR